MANKKNWLAMLVMVLVFGMTVSGCALFSKKVKEPAAPTSFQSGSTGDTTILLRRGLDFDQAFREVIFILNRHGFEPEMMNNEAGYVRTRWNTSWATTSASVNYYRVRVTVSFNPSRTQLILSAPAEFLRGAQWQTGYDTKAIETLRTDITQIIGN